MKKALVIGSSVVDVIINVDHLPLTKEDVHISSWQMALGGCAFNASYMMHLFNAPYLLCSPIGQGVYGDFVKKEFKKRGLETPILVEEENGFCLCMVENSGERTFMSYHGVEYTFNKEWLKDIDLDSFDSVYVCGLEIEEKTGYAILDFLEQHPYTVFFAPGPRIHYIQEDKLQRLFKLGCILHLNDEEALSYSNKGTIEESAIYLNHLTNNIVIITLGKDGAYYYDGTYGKLISGYPSQVTDTIGAGDGHIGALMACLNLGDNFEEAINKANLVASEIIKVKGATLTPEQFNKIVF